MVNILGRLVYRTRAMIIERDHPTPPQPQNSVQGPQPGPERNKGTNWLTNKLPHTYIDTMERPDTHKRSTEIEGIPLTNGKRVLGEQGVTWYHGDDQSGVSIGSCGRYRPVEEEIPAYYIMCHTILTEVRYNYIILTI